MSAEEWRRAVAAVLDEVDGKEKVRGTAFFIGPDVALTCRHVVEMAKERPLRLRTVGSPNAERVLEVDVDEERDLALLRVRTRKDREIVRLDPLRPTLGRRVCSYGFPYDLLAKYPEGYGTDPVALGPSTTLKFKDHESPMLVLTGKNLARGMSGGPVLDVEDGAVVGLLRITDQKTTDTMAIPAATVVERWDGVFAGPDGPPPAYAALTGRRPVPEAMAESAWVEFNPNALHCVVLGSEQLATEKAGQQLVTVAKLVRGQPKAGTKVWEAFKATHHGTELVDGTRRDLSAAYGPTKFRLAALTVQEAFDSAESFALAVRLLIEADIALVDVTGFEPGVMLLLGVRAATRRGVTVASHGGGWQELNWSEAERGLDRPFNLSDLALASHSPRTGDDNRVDRLSERIVTGFTQLGRQPLYRDLPVYDALRQLGSKPDAWSTIPLQGKDPEQATETEGEARGEVLVLCSYAPKHLENWDNVLISALGTALFDRGVATTIYRLNELKTPQVVSQSLYERIRRCQGCIADWTGSSPSTFFELGVRIAASPWGVVQIVSNAWLDSQAGSTLAQVELMGALLHPMVYATAGGDDIGSRVADALLHQRKQGPGDAAHPVRRTVIDALGRVEERLPTLHDQLQAEADALSTAGADEDVPQTLFYEVRGIKVDREHAALERRLAAWYYLEHRRGAADPANPLHEAWRTLGSQVAAALYKVDEIDLADGAGVRSHDDVQQLRSRGDALLRSGRAEEANAQYERALELVRTRLREAEAAGNSAERANLLGMQGGLQRRLGDSVAALASYREGAGLETANDLPATYNRTNAFKLELMTDKPPPKRLAELTTDLQNLLRVLARGTTTDPRVTDDAWSWADLGDVHLLLGDDAAAVDAYRRFAEKARSTSPALTLKVIKEVAEAMQLHKDPDADRVSASVQAAERVLGT
jgi:tetratricopeptide (TPR) repeat protein